MNTLPQSLFFGSSVSKCSFKCSLLEKGAWPKYNFSPSSSTLAQRRDGGKPPLNLVLHLVSIFVPPLDGTLTPNFYSDKECG